MKTYNFNINGCEFSVATTDLIWCDAEHESTQYMMQLISKYVTRNKSVVDIGTGSGILSVLCGKLGIKNILALDIDQNALECAEQNFKINNIDIEIKKNNLTYNLDQKFDVVLANLHWAVQFENIKTVANSLNDDGLLIMSWKNIFNFEDYVNGFEVIEHIKGVEYDGYVLKKAY